MPETGAAKGLNFDGLDRREDARFVLLLRPAKIIAKSGEYLCILRDVANKGVRLRLFHPLPPDPFMLLELANGDRYQIEKVWERGEQAGFTFTDPTVLDHLLTERSRFKKRQLRARIEVAGRLSAGGVIMPVVLRDISQQGGRIECDAALAIDQRVSLEAKGLPKLDAKIRWRRPPAFGLVFEQTFKLDELARLLHRMQPFAATIPDAEDEADAIFRQARQA